MSVIPPGEQLRRALDWITDQRRADPSRPVLAIVDEAAARFNLAPNQEQFLVEMILEAKKSEREPA